MSCPRPSCDALLDTEPSLRFHFIDDHGFGRTWPGRARSDLVSTGESDKEEDGVQEQKKRKGKPTDDEGTSQWMASAPLKKARLLSSGDPLAGIKCEKSSKSSTGFGPKSAKYAWSIAHSSSSYFSRKRRTTRFGTGVVFCIPENIICLQN
jgi:hypothetical protein